ncbi:MAG: endonuclease/exonuclease/phosphatase family protein [Bacteroidaceae bacterium]
MRLQKAAITIAIFCISLISIRAAEPHTYLRIGTFNIRYDNPKDGINRWSMRKDSIYCFLGKKQPDIIGLQEVLHHQLQDLLTAMPNYESVGVGRDDGKTKGEYAPILYRKDKYQLLNSSTFWLSEHPESASRGWDAACTRIATWALLKDKLTGHSFFILNTHFDHIGTEARRQSALLILKQVQKFAGNYPALITGDLNISDQEEAYQIITSNAFMLKDCWKIALRKEGPEYTFQDFGKRPKDKCKKIDFIFVTPQITVTHAEIIPSALSNLMYLSDHNSHFADVTF